MKPAKVSRSPMLIDHVEPSKTPRSSEKGRRREKIPRHHSSNKMVVTSVPWHENAVLAARAIQPPITRRQNRWRTIVRDGPVSECACARARA